MDVKLPMAWPASLCHSATEGESTASSISFGPGLRARSTIWFMII
jgi:hypothetical protein